MFLCEVAVGETKCVLEAEDFSGGPPAPFDSVMGCGKREPSSDGMFVLRNGIGVPLGKLNNTDGRMLNYNEYVVYDESRVCIRYVILYE
jgi:hypothetical protein